MIKLLEHTRRPDITFNRNGIIRLTARLARALNLRPGDQILINISKGEYLLHAIQIDNPIANGPARCYPTNHGGKNFRANSVRLCRTLLDNLQIKSDRVSFMAGWPIQIDGTTYIPIITKKPIYQ